MVGIFKDRDFVKFYDRRTHHIEVIRYCERRRRRRDRNTVQREKEYTSRYLKPADYESRTLAVDTTGQQALIGGSRGGFHCFAELTRIHDNSNHSIESPKYNQMVWSMANNHLCRLQFKPSDNNLHAVTLYRGLKIVDSTRHLVVAQFNPAEHSNSSHHWSDWHPREPNLLANCNELALDLTDMRQNLMRATLRLAGYSRTNDWRAYSRDGFATSCLWSANNDNQLIVATYKGSIVAYDMRNLSAKTGDITVNVDGCYISDLQMTPNGRHLFAWCRSNQTLYQWSRHHHHHLEDGSNQSSFWSAKLVDEYEWNSNARRGDLSLLRYGLQYHASNTHLFWPERCALGGRNYIHSVQACPGDSPDGRHQIFTLDNMLTLGVWSWTDNPKEERTKVRRYDVERHKRMKFYS